MQCGSIKVSRSLYKLLFNLFRLYQFYLIFSYFQTFQMKMEEDIYCIVKIKTYFVKMLLFISESL